MNTDLDVAEQLRCDAMDIAGDFAVVHKALDAMAQLVIEVEGLRAFISHWELVRDFLGLSDGASVPALAAKL